MQINQTIFAFYRNMNYVIHGNDCEQYQDKFKLISCETQRDQCRQPYKATITGWFGAKI